MDATHREFLDRCAELEAAPVSEWPRLLADLARHTEAHFAQEEAWMRESGFPARREHEAEHRRLLGEASTMLNSLQRGRPAFARAWLQGLPDWFRAHLATMDSALAGHLKVRGMG